MISRLLENTSLLPTMEIYITKGIKQIGPHPKNEVRDLIGRGEIHETDLAWHEGLSDWVTVAEILHIAPKTDKETDSPDLPNISESPETEHCAPQQALEDPAESKIAPSAIPATPPSLLSSPLHESPDITSEISKATPPSLPKSTPENSECRSDNPPSAATGHPRKRWVAGTLAITLGWIGVHKFYLGYKKEGYIMLAIVFGSFFFFFYIIWIIALIEGIIYLTKSDEEFGSAYVSGRKGWF